MVDRTVVVRLIGDTGDYRQSMRGAAQDTRGVGDAGDETGKRLEGLKGVLATVGAGAFVKLGVDLNALKQQAQASFTTLTGSASAARGELDLLQRNFGSSQFGFENVVKAGQRLASLNVPLVDVNRMLGDVSDAVSAVGGGSEEFDRITLSLGQMLSKGKVQAEEMMQLAEAGLGPWQLLAKEIGTSVPEAMNKVSRGEVSAQQGVAALMKGIESRFGGATERAGDTWNATLAKLKAETAQAAGEIVEPLMRIGTQGAQFAKPILSGVGDVGRAFSGLPAPLQHTALAIGAVALFSGRLNAVQAAGRGVLTRFGEQMAVQRALAAANGQQLGRFGAVVATTQARMGGLSRAGAGVTTALGGPLGIALIAGTFLLSDYQERQQQAGQAAAAHAAEIQNLTGQLDKNTLRLGANAQATQVDTFLSQKGTIKGTFTDDKYDTYTMVQGLKELGISADLARRALSGDREAAAELRAELKNVTFGDDRGLGLGVATALEDKLDTLGVATKQTADEMRLRLPSAASASGASAQILSNALAKTARDGSDLRANLMAAGLTAQQAAVAYSVLAGASAAAGNAAAGMGANYAAAQGAIAKSAGSFISLTGAWDAARQANTPTGGSGGGGGAAPKQKPLPKLEDDRAYKKAKQAEDEFDRQQKKQDRLDRERGRSAKKVADADSAAPDAARDRASAIRDAASAAEDAARDAEDAVKKAQDQKDRADRNARDAAGLAAAVRDQMGRAGAGDRAAYSSALTSSTAAASSTAAERDRVNADLAAKQADSAAKTRAAKTLQAQADAAERAADAQKKRADAARKAVDNLQAHIEDREYRTEKVRDRLQARREKAEASFNRRLKAMEKQRDRETASSNAGVSGSYGSMASSVKVSLEDYLKQLRGQVTAQRKWKDDLLLLAAKIPPGMATELAKLGPEAAPLIDSLTHGTRAQLRDFVRLFGQSGDDAAGKLSTELTNAVPVIEAVAKNLGSKAASKLARAIRDGKTDVNTAISQLGKNGINLTAGLKNKRQIEAWLRSLDDKPLDLNAEIRINRVTQKDKNGHSRVVEVAFPNHMVARARGGWIPGGSGVRDDVPIPLGRNPSGLMAMGGEYMVRKDIAQKNKPFFDQLDRTGRLPQQQTQVVMPMINLPAQAPTRVITNHITVVQRESQSAADLLREVDRLADTGMGAG